MIIVNLMGGLGNQMFQYACGLALSNTVGKMFSIRQTYTAAKHV